jgi:hypothetical protein
MTIAEKMFKRMLKQRKQDGDESQLAETITDINLVNCGKCAATVTVTTEESEY